MSNETKIIPGAIGWSPDFEGNTAGAHVCTEKHTKYQPPRRDWCCPRCGAKAPAFHIDLGDVASEECKLLHEVDTVVCDGKGERGCPGSYAATGFAFAVYAAKEKHLVPCARCDGTGFVKRMIR